MPGARVSWGLDVVQPQRRQHTDFRGAEGEDRDAAASPQLRGREELRTLGRMLASGLGVGDAWAILLSLGREEHSQQEGENGHYPVSARQAPRNPSEPACISCLQQMLSISWHGSLPRACSVTQSCPTLFDPMDCSPPGYSVHGDSPGKNTRVGCHVLLQGIFLTQGSNSNLLPPALVGGSLTTGTPGKLHSSLQSHGKRYSAVTDKGKETRTH